MRLTTLTTLLTTLLPFTTAYTNPDYAKAPTGNAITHPSSNNNVTAGKPFTIEWKPSTTGPISLVLLRGPSTNVKPIDTLAEKIDNSGNYVWTPSKKLEPDTTHYGLLLVVEGSGQYQYSMQFGVENPDYDKHDKADSDVDENERDHGEDHMLAGMGLASSTSDSNSKHGPVLMTAPDGTRTSACAECSPLATPVSSPASISSPGYLAPSSGNYYFMPSSSAAVVASAHEASSSPSSTPSSLPSSTPVSAVGRNGVGFGFGFFMVAGSMVSLAF